MKRAKEFNQKIFDCPNGKLKFKKLFVKIKIPRTHWINFHMDKS
jgi:hypothetical protein